MTNKNIAGIIAAVVAVFALAGGLYCLQKDKSEETVEVETMKKTI